MNDFRHLCDFIMGLFDKPKLCTKFEVASFSHYINIKSDPQILASSHSPGIRPLFLLRPEIRPHHTIWLNPLLTKFARVTMWRSPTPCKILQRSDHAFLTPPPYTWNCLSQTRKLSRWTTGDHVNELMFTKSAFESLNWYLLMWKLRECCMWFFVPNDVKVYKLRKV